MCPSFVFENEVWKLLSLRKSDYSRACCVFFEKPYKNIPVGKVFDLNIKKVQLVTIEQDWNMSSAFLRKEVSVRPWCAATVSLHCRVKNKSVHWSWRKKALLQLYYKNVPVPGLFQTKKMVIFHFFRNFCGTKMSCWNTFHCSKGQEKTYFKSTSFLSYPSDLKID